jgi:hypothetical protein
MRFNLINLKVRVTAPTTLTDGEAEAFLNHIDSLPQSIEGIIRSTVEAYLRKNAPRRPIGLEVEVFE